MQKLTVDILHQRQKWPLEQKIDHALLFGEELWEDIAGYDGKYQISTMGRVRSTMSDGCRILKPEVTPKGYLRIRLLYKGRKKSLKIHRLVMMTFSRNVDNKPQVDHINGNTYDNRLINLRWCTNAENQLWRKFRSLPQSKEQPTLFDI